MYFTGLPLTAFGAVQTFIILVGELKHATTAVKMINWIELSKIEEQYIWDFIFSKMKFQPHGPKANIIELSKPNLHLDIQGQFGPGFSKKVYNDLHKKFVSILKDIIGESEYIYALNWNHTCYKFSPFLEIPLDSFGEWLISPFPNGDILFFLTMDLQNVYVADGINEDIYVSGIDLIEGLRKYEPILFKDIYRR